MNNQEFIKTLGVADKETLHKVLNTMEKYGDNHWWEPGSDQRTFAYYQTNEDIYLSGDRKRLGEALPILLGRPVYGPMTEFHPANIAFLRDEAKRAWKNGTPSYTEDEIDQIYIRLFVRMQRYGENVIVVQTEK